MSEKVRIVPTTDGGYMVSGDFEVVWPSGTLVSDRKIVNLCRCGASKNKPFCDDTHKTIGFKSREGDEDAFKG